LCPVQVRLRSQVRCLLWSQHCGHQKRERL
jgi:hypothetical protein